MATIFSNGINATVAILTELGATYGVSTLPELEQAIIADQKARIKSAREQARQDQKASELEALEATAQTDIQAIQQATISLT